MRDDDIKSDMLPSRCRCGADARIRYRIPCHWVECKKKCGMKTGFFPDRYEHYDPEARERAVEEWNRMVMRS